MVHGFIMSDKCPVMGVRTGEGLMEPTQSVDFQHSSAGKDGL